MSYRYTNTDKWNDSWFSNLKPAEKLLFIYLYENCDIAGFIEINTKRWSSDIGSEKKLIEGALKGLQRGLVYSNTNDCVYLKTFLKHQKNLPLNPEKNMAHRGIIKRFEVYKFKFEISDVFEFIEGALKGLQSPYGNGIGNGNGNNGGLGEEIEPFNFKKSLIALGVEEKIASDWLAVRKKKKGANTETAFAAIKKQIELSSAPANDCIKKAVEKSWCGFEAEWYHNANGSASKVINNSSHIRVEHDSSY